MTEKQLPTRTIESLLESGNFRKRFEDMLGKKAAGFISSIISAVNQNKDLKLADPITVISAAAVAASLDLPINPSLGFAFIVPYKVKGSLRGQFQMGWKGFVQLAMRSGQYRTINVAIVREGELIHHDKFTGDMRFDSAGRKSDKILGFMAYMRLINGFEKYFYMTLEETQAHGQRYSQSYNNPNSRWQQDFNSMALKTVIKMLLSKWGVLSIEMQTAMRADQAIIKEAAAGGEEYEYPDNPEEEGDGLTVKAGSPSVADLEAVQKFDTLMEEKKADQALLQEFLTENAKINEMTVDQIKVEAMKEIEGFSKHFSKFVEMRSR